LHKSYSRIVRSLIFRGFSAACFTGESQTKDLMDWFRHCKNVFCSEATEISVISSVNVHRKFALKNIVERPSKSLETHPLKVSEELNIK
jgi:hypothetical protein